MRGAAWGLLGILCLACGDDSSGDAGADASTDGSTDARTDAGPLACVSADPGCVGACQIVYEC